MTVIPALLQVSNVDQSIAFYTQVLGLHLIRKQDYPAGRFTLASLGYGDAVISSVELSHNWGLDNEKIIKPEKLKLEVNNAIKVCGESKYAKGEVIGFLEHAKAQATTAILKDPDGHIINIVEKRHEYGCAHHLQ